MSYLVKISLVLTVITATIAPASGQGDFIWGEEVGGNFTHFNKLEARNGRVFCYGTFFDVQTIGGYTLNSANGNTFRARINSMSGQIEEVAQSPIIGHAVSDTEVIQLERISASNYLLKCLSHTGMTIWCHTLQVTGNGEISLEDVGRDEFGNFFLLTSFNVSSISYSGNPSISGEMKGLFVWKLFVGGYHSWFHKLDPLGSKGGSIAVFGNGEVLTAHYLNTNIVISRFSSSTGLLWSKQLQTNQSAPENIKLVRTSANNFYVGGTYRYMLNLGPGAVLTSAGERDGFLAKFNPDGGLIWAKSFGGANDDVLNDFSADVAENVYCVGVFENSMLFDSLTLEDGFQNAFTFPAFVAKYNASGEVLSADVPKATTPAFNQTQFVSVIASDSAAYIAGRALGPTTFGSLMLGANMNGMYYPFVVKYRSDDDDEPTTHSHEPVASENLSLDVWPNPSNGSFKVTFNAPDAQQCRLTLFDNSGREVASEIGTTHTNFALSLDPGIYMLNATSGDKTTLKRVVIAK